MAEPEPTPGPSPSPPDGRDSEDPNSDDPTHTPEPSPGPSPEPPPPIPGPPAPPKTDGGAGEWNSQPWYATFDDLGYAELAAAAASAADVLGYTHAAAHLDHYLDNTGDTLNVNVDSVLHDVSEANDEANAIAEDEIRRVASAAVSASDYDNPTDFVSSWKGFYITKEINADWFFAMGGIRMAASGIVTTFEPEEGAQPKVFVQYKIHIFDRYNWDEGKSTEIAGVTVTDKRMGELHTAGLAREYDIKGSSDVREYEGPIPDDKAIDLPGSDDSRDGERTDPTR